MCTVNHVVRVCPHFPGAFSLSRATLSLTASTMLLSTCCIAVRDKITAQSQQKASRQWHGKEKKTLPGIAGKRDEMIYVHDLEGKLYFVWNGKAEI